MRVKPTGLKLHSVGNEAFTYETPPEHIRLHTAMLAVAKARSGKSFLLTGILSQLKKAGCMDRILVVSDTFDSNRKLMESLNIRASDVFSPSDPDVVQKIIDVIESERDDLLRYRTELERYKKLDKHFMNASVWDDYLTPELLSLYNPDTDEFEEPKHWLNGRRPVISVFCDDIQSSPVCANKAFRNLVIKRVHLGAFPDGSPPVGCSLFICIQNYTSQGSDGIPKSIRGNVNQVCIWRTGNKKELDLLMTELSGQIPKEKLIRAYNAVMDRDPDDKHACLVVDLNPKPHHPSPFRINYTDWLILDD
tara:strand:- start:194 stop:1114 length:921 start_codon:yes stop_codon:yes gene_type:complete